MTIQIKISVKCPHDAHKHVNKLKTQILLTKKPVEQVVIDDQNFYWIIEEDNINKINDYIKRAAKSEVSIKKFYNIMFKIVDRANKIGTTFKKGKDYFINWCKKRLRKLGVDTKTIDNMDDDTIIRFIDPYDREFMQEFLKQDLIHVAIIK